MALSTLILAHVAGVPVEEMLPAVMVGGFAGLRAAMPYLRWRWPWARSRRVQRERHASPARLRRDGS